MVNTVVDPNNQSSNSPPAKPHVANSWETLQRTVNQHEFAHYQRRSGAYLSGEI